MLLIHSCDRHIPFGGSLFNTFCCCSVVGRHNHLPLLKLCGAVHTTGTRCPDLEVDSSNIMVLLLYQHYHAIVVPH